MEKKRILAVDDGAVNLTVIEKVLGEDYTVISVLNGKRAIKFLTVQHADLVLLDVLMPELDGIETLEEIRKLDAGKDIPVIFLTASEDDTAMEKGRELGIIDYIKKPFEAESFKKRIDSIFE